MMRRFIIDWVKDRNRTCNVWGKDDNDSVNIIDVDEGTLFVDLDCVEWHGRKNGHGKKGGAIRLWHDAVIIQYSDPDLFAKLAGIIHKTEGKFCIT